MAQHEFVPSITDKDPPIIPPIDSEPTSTLKYVSAYGLTPETKQVSVLTASELPEPEASGYHFKGWYYDLAFKDKAAIGDTLTEEVTLYAWWIKVKSQTLNLSTLGLSPGSHIIAVRSRGRTAQKSSLSELTITI